MRHYQRIFCYQHCCTLCIYQENVRYRIQNTASAMLTWRVQKSRAMRWVEIYRLFAFNTPQFSWFRPFRWKQLQSRRLMVQHEKELLHFNGWDNFECWSRVLSRFHTLYSISEVAPSEGLLLWLGIEHRQGPLTSRTFCHLLA